MGKSNATKAENQAVKAKIYHFRKIMTVSHYLNHFLGEKKVAGDCRRLCESNLRKLLAEARGMK